MQLVQVEQVRFFTMLALKLIGEPKNVLPSAMWT